MLLCKIWHREIRSAMFRAFYIPLIFVIAGCLPKDVSEPTPTETGIQYQDFSGITSAETLNDNRVLIKWNPSSDSKVIAYNIYDATFRFSPKLIRTVTAPAAQVTLNGLATQSLYSFRVRAADEKNEEDSNTKDLQAIPYAGVISSQVISSTSSKITYTAAPNVDEVGIFCKTNSVTQYERFGTIRNPSVNFLELHDLIPGTTYTCRAAVSIDGFFDNNPATTTFIPMGQASEIIFSTQPGNGTAGSPLTTQPIVTIRDANGNVVAGGPDSTALITLTVATASPTSGIVNGTVSIAAVAGVATFPDININEAGVKIISASKSDTSSEPFGTAGMSTDSSSFTIIAGPASPSHSSISISPIVPPADPLIANGTDSYSVSIRLRDQFDNPIVGVRPTFASNVTGDALGQPTANTNASGITTATISATVADTPPSVVRAIRINTPSGLDTVTALAPFRHGAASKLAFTTQPLNSPAGIMGMNALAVAVQDAQGNTVNTGATASSEITLSISANVNGAIMTGTNPKIASNGSVSFTDIGIDRTGTGYRLVANAGTLAPAYSNTFNVTAGVPKKISITGPANTLSGSCSTVVTIQLQDLGNNPANAIQNTPVIISGLGSASMYTASNCSGAPLSATMIFTAGTNTKTVYLRNNNAQAATMLATDSSAVMTQGSLATTFSPQKVGLLAQAASPAPPLTPLKVAAGACSTEILITPMGFSGNAGPTFMPTTVALTGLGVSPTQIFSDAACTNQLNPSSIVLPINSGPTYAYKVYLKDIRAEVLTLSVTDPNGILETTTGPQSVTVTPSNIHLTGPTSVVAGMCSSAFTLHLRDGEATNATALVDTALTINGVAEASTGRFYTSASCTGGGVFSSVTFPQNSSTLLLYFKGTGSGTYNINFSDPASVMTTSATVNLQVSPSAFKVTKPVIGTSNTNICAGPFVVETLDSLNQPSNAVTAITANLTGSGPAGHFFSNNNCTSEITSLTFSTGQNSRSFYFMGYYPEPGLTFTATDAAAVLSPANATWIVTGKPAWIGTAATAVDSSNNSLWFRPNAKPVAARYDGIFSATRITFDPTFSYLYVTDADYHRVIKYDYTNGSYIGWIGMFRNVGNINITGSTLAVPSNAQCANTQSGQPTPGWCVGGQTDASTNNATGRLYAPAMTIDDGTYIYVANRSGHSVTRYVSATGAFAGFIGWITNNSAFTYGPNGPAECETAGNNTVTPGWCRTTNTTGANGWHSSQNPQIADGRLNHPRGLAYDSDYLYVLNLNNISRYDRTTGAFTGWIGRVSATPTSGAPGCSGQVTDEQTVGWCIGGSAKDSNPMTAPIGGIDNSGTGIYVVGNYLYAVRSNGVVIKYDKDSGAVIGNLPSLTNNWISTGQMTTDGSKFYFADHQRIIRSDMDGLLESWIGKVASNSSMSGNPGCNALSVNDDTPGWCLGGTSRPGFDNTSFRQMSAIAYDGAGKLIVGQVAGSGAIRRFDVATGNYEGTLSLESIGPTNWSNNYVMPTERNGFDDTSLFNPMGLHVNGDSLFVADFSASRIKKMNRKTGANEGWIGVVTSRPTGGQDPNCLLANPFAASPSWCTGANFLPSSMFNDASMINTAANGIMHSPVSMASDATYLYVSDYELHRITRYRISTGVAEGWIGNISTSPTGGAPGCNGAPVDTFTPGWCTGGRSKSGAGDGMMNRPIEIVVNAGKMYVADRGNNRILSYNTLNGSFNGWIGRIGTTPSNGCTFSNNGNYDVSTSGWCLGGTAAAATTVDRGGGFYFWANYTGGLTTDGTHLYIANFYNTRIDKYDFDGLFLGSVRTREDIFTNSWSTNPVTISAMAAGCSYPMSIWTDGTYMYGTNHQPCTRSGDTFSAWKMDLSTGQMLGWQGGIFASNLPHDGDPGCPGATERTPGWCKGGATTMGLRLGQFSGTVGHITGDSHFVYVTDITGNRITRLPK